MTERHKPMLMQVFVASSPDGKSGKLTTMRADRIKSSEKRHLRLTDSQQEQADLLYERIGRFFSENKAAWRDGFLRDQHPEAELRTWKHVANVVDYLWYEEPKILAKLTREQLAKIAVAVSARIIDIPAHAKYANDAMVTLVKSVFAGQLLENGSIPTGSATGPESDLELLKRISTDESILHGKPSIRGLRYPVDLILELLDSGMTDEEILEDYEDLELQDLRAAELFASLQTNNRRQQLELAEL